jgi:protein LTV1
MPRKKWIDKKTATHFTLVYRPQNDPLIHDAEASSMVLNPTKLPNSNKVKKLDELASELGSDVESIRNNEGEAANHGIYYDDTEYDYMQHMRDLGSGGNESYFVEVPKPKSKGKEKQSLEDALRDSSLDDGPLLDDDILPSKNLRKISYQSQQDIPDALAGLQPDMDPRLREVLEALEDEAYVEDDDEIFGELAKDGEELDENEFEQSAWDEVDEGWESDDTAKPTKEYKQAIPETVQAEIDNDEREDHGDGDWMASFNKFKKDQKIKAVQAGPSDMQSSLMTTTTNGGRRKKRKGALTNPSSYSMTSSSIFRTEGLTYLDARFEKIEEQYGLSEDVDDMASVSAASSIASSVQGPVRGDFDNIMDDFLGNYSMSGKKNVKKGKYQSGVEQLDEVRRGLGPARITSQKA